MLFASPKFDLADIRDVVGGKTIKKEKHALVIPKAPIPVKVSGSGSKKDGRDPGSYPRRL